MFWILVVVCTGTILSRALDHTGAIQAQPTKAVILEGCTGRDQGRPFARTELFFGKAKPDGSMVTDEEFRAFLAAEYARWGAVVKTIGEKVD